MKKKLSGMLIISAIAMPGAVYAQANNFQGFNAGLSLSSVGASTTGTYSSESVKLGDQNIVPTVDFGYTHALNEKNTIGISVDYDLSKTNAGQVTSSVKVQGKNHYSINLKPGYAMNKDVLLYGIIGYHQLTGSISGLTGTKDITGYGVGAGSQISIDKSLYLKLEAQQINFNKETILTVVGVKVSTTVATVGIGYKF